MNYKYPAIDLLNTYETEQYDTVIICCYCVNLKGIKPILSYLFQKDIHEEYNFIELDNNTNLQAKIADTFSFDLNQNIIFKGFKKYKNKLYAFYKLIENNEIISNYYKKCLIYEILNIKQIRNYNISNDVIDFFYHNTSFNYLYDNHNKLIEIPIVAFKMVPDKKYKYNLYNEILLEPNDDYYKLKLYYSNEKSHITIRYAVFLQNFISLLNNNQKEIYTNLKIYDTIILPQNKEIIFKKKLHQLLIL